MTIKKELATLISDTVIAPVLAAYQLAFIFFGVEGFASIVSVVIAALSIFMALRSFSKTSLLSSVVSLTFSSIAFAADVDTLPNTTYAQIVGSLIGASVAVTFAPVEERSAKGAVGLIARVLVGFVCAFIFAPRALATGIFSTGNISADVLAASCTVGFFAYLILEIMYSVLGHKKIKQALLLKGVKIVSGGSDDAV